MTQSEAGGLLVAFIGALIGTYYPSVVIAVVGLLGLIIFGKKLSVYYDTKRPWLVLRYREYESRVVSVYYRLRVRVLVHLGLVKSRR